LAPDFGSFFVSDTSASVYATLVSTGNLRKFMRKTPTLALLLLVLASCALLRAYQVEVDYYVTAFLEARIDLIQAANAESGEV
jgi:hypothetical protein